MLNNKDNTLIIKDNSEISLCDEAIASVWGESLHNYSAKALNSLCLKHSDFNSIPFLDESQENEDIHLFSYKKDSKTIKTGNIGGFFGFRNKNDERLEIRIQSRFDDTEQQFFVRYILAKLSGIELIPELSTQTDFDGNYDFLLFLFPDYLRLALSQGIFRTYKYFNYNDSKPKGRIDVSRHLSRNIPFQGNIAYSFREYTGQNDLLLMVREVIELISHNLPGLLNNNPNLKKDCQTIRMHTPYYGKISRWRLMDLNSRPIKNPFYTNYELLRQLCIHILRNDELRFSSKSDDEIYGVVYDLSWLWEEYLNVLFRSVDCLKGFTHSLNRSGENYLKPFTNSYNNNKLFPDFYRDKSNPFVFDAKYKDYAEKGNNLERNDLLQITSYMHILKTEFGALVFPMKSRNDVSENKDTENILTLSLKGYGGNIYRFPLEIPGNSQNFNSFVKEMKNSEEKLISLIEDSFPKTLY